MSKGMTYFTDTHIKFIGECKNKGFTYLEIAELFNDEFEPVVHKTPKSMESAYHRHKHILMDDDSFIANAKAAHSARKRSGKAAKANRILLDHSLELEDILNELKGVFKKLPKHKIKKITPPKTGKITLEAMLSDLHYGLKTITFSSEILRERMRTFTNRFLFELNERDASDSIVLLNGDIMQSATMHKDSGESCDLTNAEQIAVATRSLYEDVLLPIALAGKPVKVIALAGNHDRERSERVTVKPGKGYYTHSIYKALELVCEHTGLDNVEFIIPDDAYYVYDVFGSKYAVEHGDLIKGDSITALENQIMRRAAQHNVILDGIRIGHFHHTMVSDLGRHIINGSPTSNDHYGDGLGYRSVPAQLINIYMERDGNSYEDTIHVRV